jgi:uncharacterized membrane protein YebE (DUF533 family)
MDAPIDLDGLVAATDASMRTQVYAAAAMAIKVDNPAESDFLAQLAKLLGVEPAVRDQVHETLNA